MKDHGEILMNGKPVNVRTPRMGGLGVRVISKFKLVGSLSVAELSCLGTPQDRGLILWDEMYGPGAAQRVGFNIDVRQKFRVYQLRNSKW